MAKRLKNNAFSLTEVLMAVAILSVGMMLIATMFPVAIYLTSVAAERTMASIIADEAFAKIQLYGMGSYFPSGTGDYEKQLGTSIDPSEFSYNPAGLTNPQYYWSAVYKKSADREYLITVFVARKTNAGLTYPHPDNFNNSVARPRPIKISVLAGKDRITVMIPAYGKYVNPPAAVVDDVTGKIYRIFDRNVQTGNQIATIDRGWEDDTQEGKSTPIWLIPPPTTGGRNSDIEVYQRIIKF